MIAVGVVVITVVWGIVVLGGVVVLGMPVIAVVSGIV